MICYIIAVVKRLTESKSDQENQFIELAKQQLPCLENNLDYEDGWALKNKCARCGGRQLNKIVVKFNRGKKQRSNTETWLECLQSIVGDNVPFTGLGNKQFCCYILQITIFLLFNKPWCILVRDLKNNTDLVHVTIVTCVIFTSRVYPRSAVTSS